MDFKQLLRFDRAHRYFSLLLAFNCFLIALVVYAWSEGHVATVFAADQTGFMISTIGVVGVLGILLSLLKSWQVSCGRIGTHASLHILRLFPNLLTGLGLIGTVLGLIIMTSNMGISGTNAALVTVTRGFSLAIYTTLAGLFFALWTMTNNAVIGAQMAIEEDRAH